MKSTVLTELPIVPEIYESNMLDMVDWSKSHSLMTSDDRAFVNGLIRYYRPNHVLEIGVSTGGGTVNILNALGDMPDSTVTSIDLAEYINNVIPVGADVESIFHNLHEDKWRLIVGKDPSEVIGSAGRIFDFAVIDSAHIHPVESLNFLCALPYLKDGAIVVLHDTAYFIHENLPRALAPRILFASVAAPKIELGLYGQDMPSNIAAFQITQDTRKYIGNVFDALLLPWRMYADNNITCVRNFIQKHYPSGMIDKFNIASNLNKVYAISEGQTYRLDEAKQLFSRIPTNTVFYGAGREMRRILSNFEYLNLPFKFPIWDQNSSLNDISGHIITTPDFFTRAEGERVAIVTIRSHDVFDSIRSKLESLGYIVFRGLESFLAKAIKGL